MLRTVQIEISKIDQVIERHSFWKAMRIMSWMRRFTHNCRTKRAERKYGQLTAEDMQTQI